MPNSIQGFTLIELLIVIVIIGVLAAVLIPNLLQARIKTEGMAIRAYLHHCTTALEGSRDSFTLRLPFTITSCQHSDLPRPLVVERPPYVASDEIVVNADANTYTIKVISERGRTFEYDGSTIREY